MRPEKRERQKCLRQSEREREREREGGVAPRNKVRRAGHVCTKSGQLTFLGGKVNQRQENQRANQSALLVMAHLRRFHYQSSGRCCSTPAVASLPDFSDSYIEEIKVSVSFSSSSNHLINLILLIQLYFMNYP